MNFSKRNGLVSIRTEMQIKSIDKRLLNRLWNVLLIEYFDKLHASIQYKESEKGQHFYEIWMEFFGKTKDSIHISYGYVNTELVLQDIRTWYFSAAWNEIFDFIEFVITLTNNVKFTNFVSSCNNALKIEMSGYRIIENIIVEITSEEEVKEIEEALTNTDKFNSVKTHLRTALGYFSNRENPDYRNSIKESISAVESYCVIITNNDKATLGEALEEIEKSHKIHGALKSAFRAIYGYTSDSGGIRHSLLEDDIEVKMEDARFMLISCSAFINYLMVKNNGE